MEKIISAATLRGLEAALKSKSTAVSVGLIWNQKAFFEGSVESFDPVTRVVVMADHADPRNHKNTYFDAADVYVVQVPGA